MPADTPDTRPVAPGHPPSPETTAGHGVDPVPTRAADSVTPQRIGPYEIVKTLGRGGMSTVYLARDERDGGEVALKVIPGGPDADPTDLARFHEEAESVARLHHPNIVRLYEVGEAPGVAYHAMEYVPGGNLYKRITKGGALTAHDAAATLEPLARAAHYAHTHGVIHRDLKPSNILLSNAEVGTRNAEVDPFRIPSSEFRVPKIADFGLAKQLDKSLRLTRSGVALGTPHYMAPEQARGDGDLVGPAADVYALGAILYECLTGHPPFGGSSALETMEQVVHKKPVPPSHLHNDIPPALEGICLRCLEKSPTRRYPTAGALADALHLFLLGKPVANPDDQATERIVIPRRRVLPLALAAAGTGVVLMLLAGAVTWFAASRSYQTAVLAHRDETEAATRAERRARLEEAIARCEHGDVAIGLERLRSLGADDTLPVREVIAAWEGRLLKPAGVQPGVRADAMAMAPSGAFAATADGDTVRVWRLPDWAPVGDAWKADGPVTALAWEDGGTRLAVGTAAGRVSIGDGASAPFAPASVVDPAGSPVSALAFDPAGVRIAFGTGPTIRWVEDDEGPWTEELPALEPVEAVALGPDGGAAVVTTGGSVKLLDPDGRRWLDLPPDGDASAVAYAADGNVVAVGTRGGTVRLWDAVARVPLTDAVTVTGPVTALAIGVSATEYTVLAGGTGSAVGWTCARPFVAAPIRLPAGPGEEVLGVAFSANGDALYVTAPSGVSVWRLAAGERFSRAGGVSPRGRYSKWWSSAGRFAGATPTGATAGGRESLLITGSDGRVFQVDPDRAEANLSVGRIEGADVTAVAAGPNGRVCICCRGKDMGTTVRHWANGMAAQADPDARLDGPVRQSAFLPDGSAVVLGCENGRVHVVDPATGRDVRPPLHCKAPVLSVAVNADGSRLLAGCADGTAHLWDRETGSELPVVRHRSPVRAVAFRGADLVTASADGTTRRWHAATGLPLGPPLAHADAVTALAVRGTQVAVGGRDRFVRVWRLP